MAVAAAKKQLRQELKRALAAMTKQQRQEESSILTSKVNNRSDNATLGKTRAGCDVHCYCRMFLAGPGEWGIQEQSATVHLPHYAHGSRHSPHSRGIYLIRTITNVENQLLLTFL